MDRARYLEMHPTRYLEMAQPWLLEMAQPFLEMAQPWFLEMVQIWILEGHTNVDSDSKLGKPCASRRPATQFDLQLARAAPLQNPLFALVPSQRDVCAASYSFYNLKFKKNPHKNPHGFPASVKATESTMFSLMVATIYTTGLRRFVWI